MSDGQEILDGTDPLDGSDDRVTGGGLNDTGITWSGNYESGNNNACDPSILPDGDNVVEAQDCSHGRDVTHNDNSDGHAGFSYTKLDSNGVPLANQNADYATTPWACVKDNVTGLIWEVKTDDGGLHDKDDTYKWYNTNPATNGGADGYENNDGNTCYGYNSSDSSTFCNTEAYVNRVNAAGWCGGSDWRMPTHKDRHRKHQNDNYLIMI
ncbi:Lcl domain-containing protein [Candidatus Electrothrix sp.]|uniref:Lcl domain-containing protein n=1 Tax=Candidatus Electrothrix sp. TaxID=2170559 RepID=UPI004056F7EC